MSDKIIGLEEFESMLDNYRKEYASIPALKQHMPHVDRGFSTLLDFYKQQKIKPFKKMANNKFTLWIVVDKDKTSKEDQNLIVKVSNFLLKIENSLKEKSLI